jgi:hypothetical protein
MANGKWQMANARAVVRTAKLELMTARLGIQGRQKTPVQA